MTNIEKARALREIASALKKCESPQADDSESYVEVAARAKQLVYNHFDLIQECINQYGLLIEHHRERVHKVLIWISKAGENGQDKYLDEDALWDRFSPGDTNFIDELERWANSIDADLTDTEERITEVLGSRVLQADPLLTVAGYDNTPHFRQILSNLCKRGILEHTGQGYRKVL